jgi:enoyl-CoA hydratase/carnithine racemase
MEMICMSEYTAILTKVEDGVATIWLNRPEHRNAFSAAMREELYAALAAFEADDGIRVIVVTGAGRYFSAGADLSSGGSTFSGSRDSAPASQGRPPVPAWQLRTPVIAAMNGSAVGMGMTIPMTWDIRIAAADGKYGFVFPRRGIVPEAGSTWLVPRLIGASRALEVMLTGRLMSGTEAAEMGLMSRALPAEEVLPAALDVARDIAANTSAMSVAATKALIYRGLAEPDRSAHLQLEHEVFRWSGRQADAAEGVVAFLQKRAPQWQMSKSRDYPPQLEPDDERAD